MPVKIPHISLFNCVHVIANTIFDTHASVECSIQFQFTLLCVLIVSLYCDMHIYISYGSLVNTFRHYLLYFHYFGLMWYEAPPYCDIHPIEINKIYWSNIAKFENSQPVKVF